MKDVKILFVCGSLEPGHDGVGDYTRALAGALLATGVETEIIAIMDRGIDGILKESQSTRGQEVFVTRLSRALSYRKRRQEYQNIIADFSPDFVSLQYVPYAFSPNGIPFRLAKLLSAKKEITVWHFMIHEAYVWDDLDFKRKVLKSLEIFILKRLVGSLRPKRIHTSNLFYQQLLSDISIDSNVLGLFGNIKILDDFEDIRKTDVLQGVFFGSGPMLSTFSIFLKGIKELYKDSNTSFNIVFCGKPDFRATDFISYLKKELGDFNINIIEKGILENDDLSLLLLQSHFGISREPPALMGKSGTVAVMLEHGLPVWVPLAEDKNDLRDKFDFRVNQCSIDLHEILSPDFQKGFQAKSRLGSISDKFYKSLAE